MNIFTLSDLHICILIWINSKYIGGEVYVGFQTSIFRYMIIEMWILNRKKTIFRLLFQNLKTISSITRSVTRIILFNSLTNKVHSSELSTYFPRYTILCSSLSPFHITSYSSNDFFRDIKNSAKSFYVLASFGKIVSSVEYLRWWKCLSPLLQINSNKNIWKMF